MKEIFDYIFERGNRMVTKFEKFSQFVFESFIYVLSLFFVTNTAGFGLMVFTNTSIKLIKFASLGSTTIMSVWLIMLVFVITVSKIKQRRDFDDKERSCE